MHVHTRNVNTAFKTLVETFYTKEWCGDTDWRKHGDVAPVVEGTSRNGRVLVIDEPMTITYSHPKERVLFNPVRDANPFFHLFESLWMLAGRNDVKSLAYYLPKIKEFSDDGKVFNGAYGYRWRHAQSSRIDNLEVDQLNILVDHLKADPTSRRAVLQLWNVGEDLLKIGNGNCTCYPENNKGEHFPGCRVWLKSLDVCCNLSVMFSLREGVNPRGEVGSYRVGSEIRHPRSVLDMTVTNRSNDLLWGCLGANYVHFTVLQEYMAARLNVEVGKYHHITNNLHVYADRQDWRPKELLEAEYVDYAPSSFNLVPLVQSPETFERELHDFVDRHCSYGWGAYSEPFLMNVAQPVCMAYHRYRLREYAGAKSIALQIQDDAWRLAVLQWLDRREQRRVTKESERELYHGGREDGVV